MLNFGGVVFASFLLANFEDLFQVHWLGRSCDPERWTLAFLVETRDGFLGPFFLK